MILQSRKRLSTTPALDGTAHLLETSTDDNISIELPMSSPDVGKEPGEHITSMSAISMDTFSSASVMLSTHDMISSSRTKMVNRAAINASSYQDLTLAAGVSRWYLDNDRTASMTYSGSDKDKTRVNLVMDCFNKYFRTKTKEYDDVEQFTHIDLSSMEYTDHRNRATKCLQEVSANFQKTLLQYEVEAHQVKPVKSTSHTTTTSTLVKAKPVASRAKKDSISAIAGRLEPKQIRSKFNNLQNATMQSLFTSSSQSSNTTSSTK